MLTSTHSILNFWTCAKTILLQACLAVLDVLSGEPLCGNVMLRSGWLAAIVPLLECGDAVVQRWADRALCSMYVAGGGHLQQPNSG